MFRNRIFNSLAIIRSVIVIVVGILVRMNRSWIGDRFFFIKFDFVEEWKEWTPMMGLVVVLLGILLLFYSLRKALQESILNGIEEGQRLLISPKYATLSLRVQQITIYLLMLVAGLAFRVGDFFWENSRRTTAPPPIINYKQDLTDSIAVIFFSIGVILLISIIFYAIQKMVTKQVLKAEFEKRMISKVEDD